MKRYFCIALASAMLFAASGCGSQGVADTNVDTDTSNTADTVATDDNTPTLLSQDTIVIGLDDEFPPMGFRDENNEIVGFDIDLAKAVGEKLGVEVEFQPIDWNAKEIELESGKVDALWNGLTITDERKENMDFTNPYIENRQIIVVKADSDIQSKADLDGKLVGIQDGSSAVEAVNADELASAIELSTYDTNILALSDLDIGRVDAVVADEIVLRYYLAHNDNDFRVIEDGDFGDEVYGVAVKKGNTELLNALQTALDEIDADGTAAEISNNWFSEDIYVHKN
jgi:polar amino acid transport system substrate-binding protein